ncbi:MAG: terminase, partial [Geminicoccaceae bacterium]|nr:terminase [Geminicoccaceae bacterium]
SDREVWTEVNPAGGFQSLEEMEVSAARAEHLPAQVASFERLYLNRWTDGAAAPWIDLALWDEAAVELDLEEIDPGTPAWVGVDLSSTSDLTAVVAVVEAAGGRFGVVGDCGGVADSAGDAISPEFLVLSKFFVPEDGIRRRSERDWVPYKPVGRPGPHRRHARRGGRLR